MFNFNFDKKMLYIFLGIIVLYMIMSHITSEGSLLSLILTVPGVLIAITFHEFAHAYAADRLGDDTPRSQGRLSLNPLDHLDPIGSILLLFAGFGWGKPVQVNPRNYTRNMSMEKADAIVSFAGPCMNFILAIIFTLIYCAIYKFAYVAVSTNQVLSLINSALYYTIFINIGLGVFNLLPLPPLDGSKILMPFLPYNAKLWFQNNENVFYFIFLIIWITGIASTIISPIINLISSGVLKLGLLIFGL